MSHDILEFAVEQPVPRERCLELAAEQGIFCPERVLTCGEDASLGRLAGDLMRSNIWFFLWDCVHMQKKSFRSLCGRSFYVQGQNVAGQDRL